MEGIQHEPLLGVPPPYTWKLKGVWGPPTVGAAGTGDVAGPGGGFPHLMFQVSLGTPEGEAYMQLGRQALGVADDRGQGLGGR